MRRRSIQFVLATLFVWLTPMLAGAQQTIAGGMTWMTQFPSTWNAGAPKLVSDGLFYYAVFCGRGGTSSSCTIARRRGDFNINEAWEFSSRTFTSNQPATVIIDRKGRLNIFYNNLQFGHIRVDHPSININDWSTIATGFAPTVAYLHASYDAVTDEIAVTFNEPSTWRLYLARRSGEGAWTYSALPAAPTGVIYLYARTAVRAGRAVVLAGEHTIDGPNFAYTAAVLFESDSHAAPWTTRVIYRVTGNNLGIPYQNWVLANDLQLDSIGRPRALLHITELGSGNPNPLDGLFLLREEDNYAPRFIGAGIEDGFTLYVDPSGTHVAFVRDLVSVTPSTRRGGVVWFTSTDNGQTWLKHSSGYADLINPALLDLRSGSMIGPDLRFMGTFWNPSSGAFDAVALAAVDLPTDQSTDRYDYEYSDDDGTVDYARAFRDVASNRFFYYIYDRHPDSTATWSYSYTAGNYYQVYVGESGGSYRYYNSDGVDISFGPPRLTALSPGAVQLGSSIPLVVDGTNFKPGAVVVVGGVPKPTTFVSTTRLTTLLVSADAPVAGVSRSVRVVNPDGTSSTNTLTLDVIGSSATIGAAPTAPASGTVTFTISGGPANRFDWVGWFCPYTSGDNSYNDWKYLSNSRTPPNAGVASATVTFTMASGGGQCVARLFADNGFVRLASSAVVSAISPVPAINSVSPATVGSGSTSITVAGTNFAPPSSSGSAVVHVNGTPRSTTFVSATQLTAALLPGDTATPGTSLTITVVNPSPGGGPSNSVNVPVASGPTVTASAGNAPPTSAVTFTVAQGPGNRTDWVGLYCPGTESDTDYGDWKYLNNSRVVPSTGMTSGSVTFIIPAGGGGSCEARLFANNGFTRLAATTISAIDFNWITLSLIPSTPTGTFSVTAVLGSPIPTTQRDWVGLFCPGTENDFSYVDWKYMNNSRVAPATAWSSPATLTFNAPAMVGMKCDVRLFRNNGFDRVITSWRATLR